MKPLLLILSLICLFRVQLSSQALDLSMEDDHLIIEKKGELELSYLPAEQFQMLDWEPGYAYYLDGTSKRFEGMKYDPEMDRIQVNAGGNILTLLPGVINGVSMERGSIVTRIFVKVPLNDPVFMELLSPGKIHLLMYREVKQEEMDMYQATDQTNLIFDKKEKPPVEYEEILYMWNDRGVKKLKNSKKSILSMMSDQKEEIESYLDENKIRLKNISDLKDVFDHYNSF